jgi:hypothetical protein
MKCFQIAAETNQGTASGYPLFKLAIADEVAAHTFNMHPKYVRPLFPPENSTGVNFEILGKLSAGNYKGFRVDATP